MLRFKMAAWVVAIIRTPARVEERRRENILQDRWREEEEKGIRYEEPISLIVQFKGHMSDGRDGR
jgi:hypothetical protein